jgi:hypothetical protein
MEHRCIRHRPLRAQSACHHACCLLPCCRYAKAKIPAADSRAQRQQQQEGSGPGVQYAEHVWRSITNMDQDRQAVRLQHWLHAGSLLARHLG